GPGRRLEPVRERAVRVALEPVDAGDVDYPVVEHRDDRAHLLEDRDQVDDLRLGGRVTQFGHAFGQHRGQQHLLGGSDARVRKRYLRAAQPLRGLDVQAVGPLLDHGAERAQGVEVEVDRPVADAAAAEVRDEGVAVAVQQRAAQQDRDAALPGVRGDLGVIRGVHRGGVEDQLVAHVAGAYGDAVRLQQAGDNAHVTDPRDVAQPA